MFEPFGQGQPRPHIFGMAPGCDFPKAVVAGLNARMAGQPPEAMGRITLYVNTERMQARITQMFTQQGACFLPRIRLITALDQDPRINLPPAPPPLRRLLEIANLVAALLQAEKGLAPRAAMFDLAASLTRLIDEMQGENVGPEVLANLDVAQHSAHWERAQAFLKIVAPLFHGEAGPEQRRRAAVAGLLRVWQANPPADPIIVAGTTGSRSATAEFMQAVCALPQGAVVLPGFDFDLPAQVWQQMDDALSCEDHPQFRFRRLMDRIGFGPGDVQQWHSLPAPAPSRNKLISLSLRPAPITDQWLRDGPDLPDLLPATQDMTLIEAPFARAEAMAIALILREAAFRGEKAALITPDRNLSRQVTAALDRWAIMPDDSAGRPLALTAAGRFMRHTAMLRIEPLSLDRLITVLKHPLAHSGADRGAHLLLLREFEIRLRRYGPAFPDHQTVLDWAGRHGQPFALEWAAALAPLFSARAGHGAQPLGHHIAAHMALSADLARGSAAIGAGALWENAAGEAMQKMMAELAEAADASHDLTASEYRALFEAVLQPRQLREPQIAHPDIRIWGTIEARVQGCDLVILGGLNDATWPRLPDPDPWLNRKMRKDAGLLLPDRQIGLAAHDYQQAICAPKVVLTRALRSDGSETVPSRWLNRLINLMEGLPDRNGKAALAAMRARGAGWLQLAQAIDRPSAELLRQPNMQPSPRPAPVPPLAARPRELPVTALERLITNPYHIYAQYVLKLRPLPPLRAQAGARDRGTAVHSILERFVKTRPNTETLAAARARLVAIAEDIFAAEVPFPSMRALWLGQLMYVADFFLAEDQKFQGATLALEQKGRLRLADLGFDVTGRPDRIDRLPDGRLHLIDYKTGSPPTEKQQTKSHKQLLFLGVMAQQGGFAELGPSEVAMISYISLSRAEKSVDSEIKDGDLQAEAQILRDLVAAYLRAGTGYTARRADFEIRFDGDYDHLMRFGEWQTSDGAQAIPVGSELVQP